MGFPLSQNDSNRYNYHDPNSQYNYQTIDHSTPIKFPLILRRPFYTSSSNYISLLFSLTQYIDSRVEAAILLISMFLLVSNLQMNCFKVMWRVGFFCSPHGEFQAVMYRKTRSLFVEHKTKITGHNFESTWLPEKRCTH